MSAVIDSICLTETAPESSQILHHSGCIKESIGLRVAGQSRRAHAIAVNIDHVANGFKYSDISAMTPTVNGLFVSDTGFLNFSQTNTPPAFQPAGFTLEILGRTALVRPGNNMTPLVASVLQSGCPTVNTPIKLQFVALPNSLWTSASNTAFGSLLVNTSSTTWAIVGIQQIILAGSPQQPGVGSATGTCAESLAGTVTTIPGGITSSGPATMALGPSGFFLVDEGSGNPGEVGVIQPSAALNTTDVVNGIYPGFEYEPALGLVGLPVTQMAAFGCTGSSCTTPPSPTSIVGGVFANDDPSQPANTDTTITLGSQDSKNNGLYGGATVTIPDPNEVCMTGTGTCTFPAVAVVGNPESKFAIFLIAQDIVNISPLFICLYQQ